jgi:hypothetical protein
MSINHLASSAEVLHSLKKKSEAETRVRKCRQHKSIMNPWTTRPTPHGGGNTDDQCTQGRKKEEKKKKKTPLSGVKPHAQVHGR